MKRSELPTTFEEVLDNVRGEGGIYFSICYSFLPSVVGQTWGNKWKVALKRGKSMQEVATPSDEAFMLLVLDNNWVDWSERAFGDESESAGDEDGSKRKRKSKAKFTASAGSSKNKGWSADGKRMFKQLRKLVERTRSDNREWDVAFLARLASESGQKLDGIKVRKERVLMTVEDDDDSLNGEW